MRLRVCWPSIASALDVGLHERIWLDGLLCICTWQVRGGSRGIVRPRTARSPGAAGWSTSSRLASSPVAAVSCSSKSRRDSSSERRSGSPRPPALAGLRALRACSAERFKRTIEGYLAVGSALGRGGHVSVRALTVRSPMRSG